MRGKQNHVHRTQVTSAAFKACSLSSVKMIQYILMPQEFSCVDLCVDVKITLDLLREYLTLFLE